MNKKETNQAVKPKPQSGAKPKPVKDKNYTFFVRINDGYCSYQYDFDTSADDVAIYDIACAIAGRLKCKEMPIGKIIDWKK